MDARPYTSPNDAVKTDKEGRKPDGETTANMEGKTRTTAIATIKFKTRGKEEVEDKKTEPHEMPNNSTENYYPTLIRKGKKTKQAVKS